MRVDELLGPEVIVRLRESTAQARGLPGRAYGAEFFAIEQRELFPRTWCVVGFSSDLGAPGDAVPVELAGWPLLLVRDGERRVRVFHNICRHRGMRIVPEPRRVGDVIACPWHGWRYSLDGRLLATPRVGGEDQHCARGLEPGGLGLVPVRSSLWHDFIFVNLDGEAKPFAEHIAPLDELLQEYDLSDLRRAEHWSIEYPGNWKVAIEGAIEDYHLPVGHPQLVRSAKRFNARLDHAPGCFYSNSTAREYADVAAANIVGNLRSGLPPIPYRGEGGARRTFFMNVFPTGMFQMHGDNAVQGMFAPLGAERTRLVFNHYFVGDASRDARFSEQRAAVVREWKLVFEQDVPFVKHVHENYKLRDAAGVDTRFSPFWESNVQRFQEAVVDTVVRQAGCGHPSG